MTRSVFYGVSAFVGSITNSTKCAFWPDNPNNLNPPFDPNALFTVDLSKNPEAVRSGAIPAPVPGQPSQVEVDDFSGYRTGGLTTIGPIFPGGATVGLCYVEESKCAGLGAYDPRQGGPGYAYEWATVVYHDGPNAGRRFYGFHGQILKSQGTNLGLVSLWARGTSQMPNRPAMATCWIDFDAFVHPIEPGLTGIGLAQNLAKTGAIFIDAKAGGGGVIPFADPKNPRSVGGAVVLGGRRVR